MRLLVFIFHLAIIAMILIFSGCFQMFYHKQLGITSDNVSQGGVLSTRSEDKNLNDTSSDHVDGLDYGTSGIDGNISEANNMIAELLSAISGGRKQIPSQEEIENFILKCDEIDNLIDKEFCIGKAALKYRQEEICERISTEAVRDWCYSNFISYTTEKSLCDKISGDDIRYFCLGTIELNKSRCDRIKALLNRELCYSNVAAGLHDIEICEEISDKNRRDECRKNAKSGSTA